MARTKLTTTIVNTGVIGNASYYKEDGTLKETSSTLNVVDSAEIDFVLTEDMLNHEADLTAHIKSIDVSKLTNVYNKTEVDTAIANNTPSFSTLTGKPSTLSGYGITDAYTKATLSFSGTTLTNTTGVARWYPEKNATISAVYAIIATPSASDINIIIKKNNISATSFTLTANAYKTNLSHPTIALTTNDYLTVDIEATGGADLSIIFFYS